MVKSLEQYLSDLSFSPHEDPAGKGLSSGERAFVEKYLGLDALDKLPLVEPEPLLQPAPPPRPRAFKPFQAPPPAAPPAPEIVIAPAPAVDEAPVIVVSAAKEDAPAAAPAPPPAAARAEAAEKAPLKETAEAAARMAVSAPEKHVEKEALSAPPKAESKAAVKEAPAEAAHEASLKEALKEMDEIQAVSFFVEGQLFLLPVAGIQEVLRHMELVRVPQAPAFVAGAVNLRGKVTPLVRLSAILTNAPEREYDPKKNFIIICGTEPLQVGLIIDRINSMHLLPKDKIIWNVEAKLGDAADFLYALVNLNDKVCGLVAPEAITKKILAPDHSGF